jgi:hypoxanthine phosphoribosyltransferase
MESAMATILSNTTSRSVEPARTWLGPPLRTLRQPAFDTACAELMRLVEEQYAPTLIVGIRTGGLIVAQSMVRAAASPLLVLPLTCRRASTGVKSRVPVLRGVLAALPTPVVNLLRRLEHRLLIAPRGSRARPQQIDHAEAEAIAAWVAGSARRARILVADDAVDSGVTLDTVLGLLRRLCPRGTEIRSAAITQTLENPKARPDYVLFHDTLCRFPWSFDANG